MPQCMLVIESMIDDVALKLGRLPEEVGVMQSQNHVLLLACLHHYTSYITIDRANELLVLIYGEHTVYT